MTGYIVWDSINLSIKSSIIHSSPEDAQRVADRLNMERSKEIFIVKYIEIY